MIDIKQQALCEKLKKKIDEGFSRHAIQMTGHDEKLDAIAFVAMEGQRFWNALHVKYVYIDEKYRGKGLGTRLMQRILTYGLEQKCLCRNNEFSSSGILSKNGI